MKKTKKRSRIGEVWHQLKKNKFAVAGLVVVILILLETIFAPLLAPYGYDTQDLTKSYLEPVSYTHLVTVFSASPVGQNQRPPPNIVAVFSVISAS